MSSTLPSVCFGVEKIIGVSDNGDSYKVQWNPVWINASNLVGCQHLIQQFHDQQLSQQTQQEKKHGKRQKLKQQQQQQLQHKQQQPQHKQHKQKQQQQHQSTTSVNTSNKENDGNNNKETVSKNRINRGLAIEQIPSTVVIKEEPVDDYFDPMLVVDSIGEANRRSDDDSSDTDEKIMHSDSDSSSIRSFDLNKNTRRSPPRRKPTNKNSMVSLLVDNLTIPEEDFQWNVTRKNLKEVFGRYGEVGDIYLPNRGMKGHAYVRYHKYADAETAMQQLDGMSIDGRKMEISMQQFGFQRRGHELSCQRGDEKQHWGHHPIPNWTKSRTYFSGSSFPKGSVKRRSRSGSRSTDGYRSRRKRSRSSVSPRRSVSQSPSREPRVRSPSLSII